MDFAYFAYFVHEPLLYMVFLLFIIGLTTRVAIFFYTLIRSAKHKQFELSALFAIGGGSLLPLYRAAIKKPAYVLLRYLFHICLVIVPVWFSGHIVLWEESIFEWYWTPIPDEWSDFITLLILGFCTFFLLRRIILANMRLKSSMSDYLFIIIVALPFVTGYFLTHGTIDSIAFFENNMETLHVFSAEILLIAAVLLFYKIRLNLTKCIGCTACELSCSTSALESNDEVNRRFFVYSAQQCICCGACVKTCPENAAELIHEISFRRLYKLPAKKEISSVELNSCKQCGEIIAPVPQIEKMGKTMTVDYFDFCPTCKNDNFVKSLVHL